MKELEKVKDLRREDEIDLLDLLKIILRNKKIIIITWIGIVILGFIFVVHSSNRDLTYYRDFSIRTIDLDLSKNGNIDVSIKEKSNNSIIINNFFNDLEYRSRIYEDNKNISFSVTQKGEIYTLKIIGKDKDKIILADSIYFKETMSFIKEKYSDVLYKDIKFYDDQIANNLEQLMDIEDYIKEIKKTKHIDINELKDSYPIIFEKKEALSAVYIENYKTREKIFNKIGQLDNLLIFESSLNEFENKMSLKLVFIIANVLGIFLGVFLVFLKEFIKSVNWKELKEVK